MKNVPSKNHYVPQHLLNNFADKEGNIWIYDAELKTLRCGISKSCGFENKLYPPEVEKVLTKIIDTPGAAAISELLKQKKLSGEQWGNFVAFVAAQMQRTPSALERGAAMSDPMFKEMAERIAKFDPDFRNNVRKELTESGATSEQIAELFLLLENGQFNVKSNPQYILAQCLSVCEKLHARLLKMRWGILQVPNGEPDLIIGDHAVMLYDKGPNEIPSGLLGVSNPHIELVMPLGRRAVAIANWDGQDSFGEIGEGSADEINKLTLSYARRFIFAPHSSEELLEMAVRLRGSGPKIHIRRIGLGNGLMIVPEYR